MKKMSWKLLLVAVVIGCLAAGAAGIGEGERLWQNLALTLSDVVYIGDAADFFHLAPDCPALGGAPASEITINRAIGMGTGLCQNCRDGLGEPGLPAQIYLPTMNSTFNSAAYILDADPHYHLSESCPRAVGTNVTPATIGEAVFLGKGYCGECAAAVAPEATVEPVVEGVYDAFGLNLPLETTVYIPETISNYGFSFGDIHLDANCTSAWNSDLVTATLEEALDQDLELCVSCAYSPSFADTAMEQTEFPYAHLGLTEDDDAYVPEDENFCFCFHFSADCSRLNGGAVRTISMREAVNSGSACELCMPDASQITATSDDGALVSAATGEMLVYYTEYGIYFHVAPDCSGMRGAQLHTAKDLYKTGKRHCPVCIAGNADRYWLPIPQSDSDSIYFIGGSRYYHRSFECFHRQWATLGTRGEAGNYAPCPMCLPELSGELRGERCWTSEDDEFYHAASNCAKAADDAAEMYAVEAQFAGKIRCHECAQQAAPPEYADRFEAAFGSGVNAAYPGYIFERAETTADGRVIWYVSTAEDASPNVWEVCNFAFDEGNGALRNIALSNSFNLSAAFLENLPDSIRALCGRPAVEAILDAMKSPDADGAAAVAANVVGIALSFDGDDNIQSCSMTFEYDFSSIELSWRPEADGYRLYNVQPIGDGWK